MNTTIELQQQAIGQAARRLLAKLPAALRKDPNVAALASESPTEKTASVERSVLREHHNRGLAVKAKR